MRILLILASSVLLVTSSARAEPIFLSWSEGVEFDAAFGPFDHLLYFRTDKTGTDTFDFTLPKDRPGDYFSDAVTFSSPLWSDPNQVLWGHFDGPDGGIGPRPSYVGPLRLDFRLPVFEVGFRTLGVTPGVDVAYYDPGGQLIGVVSGSVSSFIGASSTRPIAALEIQGTANNPFHITALRFNQVSEPGTLLLTSLGLTIGALFRRHRH